VTTSNTNAHQITTVNGFLSGKCPEAENKSTPLSIWIRKISDFNSRDGILGTTLVQRLNSYQTKEKENICKEIFS
jgi:hypothetical protein